MLHLPLGSMPHEDIMKAIRLFGEEVAPRVREYFKNKIINQKKYTVSKILLNIWEYFLNINSSSYLYLWYNKK